MLKAVMKDSLFLGFFVGGSFTLYKQKTPSRNETLRAYPADRPTLFISEVV